MLTEREFKPFVLTHPPQKECFSNAKVNIIYTNQKYAIQFAVNPTNLKYCFAVHKVKSRVEKETTVNMFD